ncbi:MAG: M23 family metallopeptidase [Kouleothrix sp.]
MCRPARGALCSALRRHLRPPLGQLATPVPPSPTPRFSLAADGPHGCPLAPGAGAVVLTQGYDEGTHAPASIWGGIDLAIDLDRDGESEPARRRASRSPPPTPAWHMCTWVAGPAGNYVRVTDEQRGWNSAYAHLDSVAVADGQAVATGALLGTVGSSGMASGPHLHYELWHGSTNVDPTGLVECR